MTSVPIPTFVPQDAWYTLTLGNLTPSIADSVPVGIDLLPSVDETNQPQDGIVGALDGGVIYLAGLSSQLDGGQGWYMWSASSMAVSNGSTVFCPYTDASQPGRWLSTGSPASGPGPVQAVQIVPAGTEATISASVVPFVVVFVQGRSANTTTTLHLPGTTFLGQTFRVKDAEGDAATYNISVVAAGIDGDASSDLTNDYQERTFVWNGSEWSVA